MSVVERAIRKIQGAAGSNRSAPKQQPVARTVAARSPAPSSAAATLESGELHGASGRAINFDFDALAAAGLLAPGNDRLADEYRAIKQPIVRKAADKSLPESARHRLIMVASALPGEGKTFTSVNLSLSLAQERDWSVLLVDTDCRNPSLSRLLGVAEQPGILDYLRSEGASLDTFVLPTNIDRLYVLPVGGANPHAAELLASDRMQSVCAELAAGKLGQYLVVFDSSPLLLTPEPGILGRQVGQVVLVVQANSTPRAAVTEAISKLDATKPIGLVLNRASSQDALTSYAYGYSYQSYKVAQ